MALILDVLRGTALRGTGLRDADAAEWDAMLTLAESERVLPSIAARLRECGVALPDDIAARLAASERDVAIAAFYWGAQLKHLLRAFAAAEIAVVALKGPMLAERLYGGAAMRVCRDLDLLVARSDLDRAEQVLAREGFALGEADDYHRPWHRQGATVELHYDVENPLAFDFHIEGALERSCPAEFQDEPCRILAPEDELLYLCLHAARHSFDRMSLIVDLRLAFERLPATAHEWRQRPEVRELDALLVLGLAMARRLQPDLSFAAVPALSRTHAAHLAALADHLWHRLLAQESEVLDWTAIHSFFVEMEPPGRRRLQRRWRHLRILLGRVIEADVVFASSFGLRRPWQARLLRPLRLLRDAIARGAEAAK